MREVEREGNEMERSGTRNDEGKGTRWVSWNKEGTKWKEVEQGRTKGKGQGERGGIKRGINETKWNKE